MKMMGGSYFLHYDKEVYKKKKPNPDRLVQIEEYE